MSYSLNSLKGGIGVLSGTTIRVIQGDTRNLEHPLYVQDLSTLVCVYLGILSFSMRLRIYLEGQGDLVSRLRRVITGVTLWLIGAISILTKSP